MLKKKHNSKITVDLLKFILTYDRKVKGQRLTIFRIFMSALLFLEGLRLRTLFVHKHFNIGYRQIFPSGKLVIMPSYDPLMT